MTVHQIGVIPHNKKDFIGASTDEKPVNCAAGSTFLETDTQKTYIYDNTEWLLEVGVKNTLLAEGVFSSYFDVQPSTCKAVMIALNANGNNDGNILSFQHYISDFGWCDWLDGQGNKVEVPIANNIKAILGPFQGFPLFEKGRIVVENGFGGVFQNVSDNQIYTASRYGTNNTGNTSLAALAFDDIIHEEADIESWFVQDTPSVLTFPQWLAVEMDTPKIITKLTIFGRDGSSTVKDFMLQGSQDNVNWTDLLSAELQRNGTYQDFNVVNTTAYKHYRIYISSNWYNNETVSLHSVRMYEYSEATCDIKVQGGAVMFYITSNEYKALDVSAHMESPVITNKEKGLYAIEVTNSFYLSKYMEVDCVNELSSDWGKVLNKLVVNPYGGIKWDKIHKYKANFHTHTTRSDGAMIPSEVIKNKYKSKGYSILVITDHDNDTGYANTFPWSNYEIAGEEGSLAREHINGVVLPQEMLSIEGVEVSDYHHHSSLDCNWTGGSAYNEYASIDQIALRGGMSIIHHPGRYSWTLQSYIDLFSNYDISVLFGIEVYNQGDRYSNDRVLWDNILTQLMPYRPVWGYSNDDMHTVDHLYRNYSTILMQGLSVSELRRAWEKGNSYTSYEPLGSGEGKSPHIENIIVDEEIGTIHVVSSNTTEYQWIANGQVISSINVIQYKHNQLISNYVRCVLINPFGTTLLNPFGFVKEEMKVARIGGAYPPFRP